MKHIPGPNAPLPWKGGCPCWLQRNDGRQIGESQNTDYAMHAANAYPRLVEALKRGGELSQSNQRAASMRHALFAWGEEVGTLLCEIGELP